MQQGFERGQELSDQSRIRKKVCEGESWEICQTNNQAYVLAVTKELYDGWNTESAFPEGFFECKDDSDVYYHVSSKGNLISSLQEGPYPVNAIQVLKFSAAFKEGMKAYGISKMQNAVYLEENALFLPVPSTREESVDAGTLYAAWLTAGVNISISQGNRLNTLMAWMPSDALAKSKELAGFENEEQDSREEIAIAAKTKEKPARVIKDGSVPSEPFELLGRPELEQFFNDNIVDIVRNREKYKRMGIEFPGATILYGPPGCGKTYAIDRLAEYLGWPRYDIDSSSVASPYIHDTSKKISEVFTKAINTAPSILVIDEMEAFLTDRASSGMSGTHHVEEVAEFLRQIPEAVSSGVLIFAMTNLIDSIDPAILRRGRFDHIVEVRMANAEEIESLLLKRFVDLPVDPNVNAKRIAKKLDGHPLSDVSFVLREAGRFAVKNDQDLIDNDCIDRALAMLPNKKEDKPRIGFQ